jgi:hypothetical protein
MTDRSYNRKFVSGDKSAPRPDSILSQVQQALTWRGFSFNDLREQIPKTQEGLYHWESYLLGSETDPANLALISLPPGVATTPSLFVGPPGVGRRDFSFTVHTLAGHGDLIIMKPGGSIEVYELYRGAPVYNVRPGNIYALQAGDRGLVVGDYCDPRFKPEWEVPVDPSKLPNKFIMKLNRQGSRGNLESNSQCD